VLYSHHDRHLRKLSCSLLLGNYRPKRGTLSVTLEMTLFENSNADLANKVVWLYNKYVAYCQCRRIEPCENGLPRCPHCNGESKSACDKYAEIKDCQNKDVSQH